MTTPSVLLANNKEAPEGILDAFITSAASLHDLKKKGNSKKGSIYIVKPKMHGPDEVLFSDEIFQKLRRF